MTTKEKRANKRLYFISLFKRNVSEPKGISTLTTDKGLSNSQDKPTHDLSKFYFLEIFAVVPSSRSLLTDRPEMPQLSVSNSLMTT